MRLTQLFCRHPLGAKASFGHDPRRCFRIDGLSLWLWLLLRKAGRNLAPARFLADCHDVARCRSQARVFPVPMAKRPDDLLLRPVLQLVAPPRELPRFDFIAFVRLEVCAKNDLHLRSNRRAVI